MNHLDPIRQTAVSHLQARLRSSRNSNATSDDIEHAALLVLSDDRGALTPAFLIRGALRDARRTRLRRHADAAMLPLDPENTELVRDDRFEAVIAREFVEQLRRDVLRARPECIGCFDAWLADEPIEDTAKALGLPVRRIKYLRVVIRDLARTMAA